MLDWTAKYADLLDPLTRLPGSIAEFAHPEHTDDLRSCSIFPFPNEVPSDRSRLFLVFGVKRETPSCVGRIRGEKRKCSGNVYEEVA